MRDRTRDPLRDLVLAFQRHGITRREDRIRLCIDHAGRHLVSSSDLTEEEVGTLLGRLERLPVGNLPGHVARLHREEEARAREAAARSRIPAGTRVCTRDGRPATAGDLEQVAEFAEQLDVLAEAGLLPAGERTMRDPG